MKIRLALSLSLSLAMLAACKGEGSGTGGAGNSSSNGGAGNSSSNGGAGNSSNNGGAGNTGNTGGGAPSGGWTVISLLDDESSPDSKAFRAGNDLVTGIRFASIDDGWITTSGSNSTFSQGGAVFKAKQHQLSSILFSGNRDGLCLLGSIDFTGIDKSKDGYVALAYACDVIASHDEGKTFDIAPTQAGDQHGIERVLAMRTRAADTLMVGDSGYLDTSASAPGPSATWATIWAPQANPPTPNPVPADLCQMGPHGSTPTHRTVIDVSADGKRIAYVSSPNFDPQVCLSTDGGHTFRPKLLPNVDPDIQDFVPGGVVYANDSTAIVFWGDPIYPGKAYVYRSTDGGESWTAVPLPADVASLAIQLNSAFFAPDGQHGWIVGFDRDATAPLLLRTTDAGATWKRSGGDLTQKLAAGGGIPRLFTGFALDENHIWVGGDYGTLAASDTGGE